MNAVWLLRAIASLGIRRSLLMGFGSMLIALLVSVTVTVIGTGQMSRSIRSIIATQLPETVAALAVARAADSLVAATAGLESVVDAGAQRQSFERLAAAQLALRTSLEELELSTSEGRRLLESSAKLSVILDELRELTGERIRLRSEIKDRQSALLENQQAFQKVLTYRVRILNSDGDILRQLLQRPDTPLPRIIELISSMAQLLAASQFQAEVLEMHADLLTVPTLVHQSDLKLVRARLNGDLAQVNSLTGGMTEAVRAQVQPLFGAMQDIAFSESGLLALRVLELNVLSELQRALAGAAKLGMQVDRSSVALVTKGLAAIETAADDAGSIRRFYASFLIGFAGVGTLAAGLFLLFYIDRYLVRRLVQLTGAMLGVARGDFDTALPPEGDDELGRLGRAVRRFQSTSIAAVAREAELRDSKNTLQGVKEALEAKATELELANARLSELSRVDELTGLANRRRFDEVIAEEWGRGSRDQNPLSLIMMDVDWFKQYNDRYGHQRGDDCLREIGRVLRRVARRAMDLPARYGGEEFCLVLPNTDAQTARVIADDVLHVIDALAIEHPHSATGRVSVSLGVTTMVPTPTHAPTELLHAADEALYQAKRSGRNRVCEFPAPAAAAQ